MEHHELPQNGGIYVLQKLRMMEIRELFEFVSDMRT